jgi:hypothetical protein
VNGERGLAVLYPAMRPVAKAADQQCVACDGVPRAFDDSSPLHGRSTPCGVNSCLESPRTFSSGF